MNDHYAIILAGGSGSRLWPLSRKQHPKQLLPLFGQKSLLQKTASRLLKKLPASRILTVINQEHLLQASEQLQTIHPDFEKNIFSEPLSKNTLPAISWMVARISKKNPDALVSVFPSDHHIENEEAFLKAWEIALLATKKKFVSLFGIQPTFPSTDYGYIEAGEDLFSEKGLSGKKVNRFVEKPRKETAESYLKTGKYFWNGGIFFFQADLFLDLLQKHQPEIFKIAVQLAEEKNPLAPKEIYKLFPNLSMDYGLMEKIGNVAVIPVQMGWNDLGNWESVCKMLAKEDQNKNYVKGQTSVKDSKNNILWSDSGVIVTNGIENLAVIQTEDVVLVTKRENLNQLKNLVEDIEKDFPEKINSAATETRPWGNYTILKEDPFFKVKKLVIHPGKRLSEQLHHHRAEHWIIVKGEAIIQIGDQERRVKKEESVYIPKKIKHRITNTGAQSLEMIEIQIGDYFGEDDIVRFDDDFGRK